MDSRQRQEKLRQEKLRLVQKAIWLYSLIPENQYRW